jgi:hypothetical protein
VRVELRHDDGREEVLDRLSWLIDASGAHSLTRASLREELEGETYPGHYLVAEAGLTEPLLPPDQHVLVVTEAGPLFLGVLPQGRRLVLTEWPPLLPGEPMPQADALRPLVGERLGRDPGGLDTSWISCFRMHRRQVPQLAEGHCFLIGDAGHLSSPWGGEGLNAGLMDAADLAWKLALVLKGEAEPALLDTYAIERGMADRHVLEVSDEQHQGIAALVASCAGGVVPTLPALDGATDRALQARRGMLDVSYAGSPLVGEFLGEGLHNQGAEPAETRPLEPGAGDRLAFSPAPGERWPDRCRLKSPRHQLLHVAVKVLGNELTHDALQGIGDGLLGALLDAQSDPHLIVEAIKALDQRGVVDGVGNRLTSRKPLHGHDPREAGFLDPDVGGRGRAGGP